MVSKNRSASICKSNQSKRWCKCNAIHGNNPRVPWPADGLSAYAPWRRRHTTVTLVSQHVAVLMAIRSTSDVGRGDSTQNSHFRNRIKDNSSRRCHQMAQLEHLASNRSRSLSASARTLKGVNLRLHFAFCSLLTFLQHRNEITAVTEVLAWHSTCSSTLWRMFSSALCTLCTIKFVDLNRTCVYTLCPVLPQYQTRALIFKWHIPLVLRPIDIFIALRHSQKFSQVTSFGLQPGIGLMMNWM